MDCRRKAQSVGCNLLSKATALRGRKCTDRSVALRQARNLLHPIYGQTLQRLPTALTLQVLNKAGKLEMRNFGNQIGYLDRKGPGAENQQRQAGDSSLFFPLPRRHGLSRSGSFLVHTVS